MSAMSVVMNSAEKQRNKIHPHKFTMWVAIASIVMMFAGLTSAYIVKREQPGWTGFTMPVIFWYSTAVMLLSSLTMQLALISFKERNKNKYKNLITATALLGIAFIIMQYIGFSQLWKTGVQLRGSGAAQFMYIIFGLHALHVLGGVITLLVMFLKAFSAKVRSYNVVPVEVTSTYWHFVDLLWVYLFVFFVWIQ
jgi:cytochrome c oxidase subunit III